MLVMLTIYIHNYIFKNKYYLKVKVGTVLQLLLMEVSFFRENKMMYYVPSYRGLNLEVYINM